MPCPSASPSLQSRHESLYSVCPDHAWTRESLPAPPGRSDLSFLEASGLNHSGWQRPWALFHCSLIMRWLGSRPQLPLEPHSMTSASHSCRALIPGPPHSRRWATTHDGRGHRSPGTLALVLIPPGRLNSMSLVVVFIFFFPSGEINWVEEAGSWSFTSLSFPDSASEHCLA